MFNPPVMTAALGQPDQELLLRYIRHRDEEAFAELVRRYADLVYSACFRVLGNSARAEEAAQETFFRLLQKPRAVERSLPGWLHHTATQLAIDALRSDSSRRRREASYAADNPRDGQSIAAPEPPASPPASASSPALPAPAPAPAPGPGEARWEDLSPLVDQALEELPEHDRLLLVEHFLGGKSQRDLAAARNCSAATVCRQIRRALDQLRRQLQRRGVIAPSALVWWLARRCLHKAPESMLCELHKMAMISGGKLCLHNVLRAKFYISPHVLAAGLALAGLLAWLAFLLTGLLKQGWLTGAAGG